MRFTGWLFVLLFATGAFAQETSLPPFGMKLPLGYLITPAQGIDSIAGTISKKDGFTIQYDIGDMAGVYVSPEKIRPKGKFIWVREGSVSGHVYYYGLEGSEEEEPGTMRFTLSFPQSNANFYCLLKKSESAAQWRSVLDILLPYAKIDKKGKN